MAPVKGSPDRVGVPMLGVTITEDTETNCGPPGCHG